jgi:hypothetical protein
MKQEYIELIVRTSDGGFESTLRVPVNSTEEQRTNIAKMWVNAIAEVCKVYPSNQATNA